MHIKKLVFLTLSCLLVSCGGGGAETPTTPTPAPAAPSLANLSGQSFTVGQLGAISLTNTGGGSLISCVVSPALPTGLSVRRTTNNASCQITGIAMASATSTDYDIRATNSGGTDTATIELEIVAPANTPPNLTDLTDQSFTVGVLKTITFSNSGGDVTASTGCAIDTSDGKPGLPNSLGIEVVTDSGTRTCQITGTPTAAAVGENTYTIIGTNTTGDDASPATVKITVTATLAAPNLADLTDQSFTVGVLKTITFSNSGGDVTASTGCAIDTSDGKPGLPNSLGIEVVTDSGTRTCQITGTPTAAAVGENTYTIIGTNTTGDDASPATVKITVTATLAAPNLADLGDQSFTVGVLKTITFSNSGGDVTASTGCAIDTSDGKPGLPNSLGIEVVTDSGTRTCQITGTPTAAAVGENTYTIIGTNTTGDDASPATVKITVVAAQVLAAPNLTDLTDQSFTVGVLKTITFSNSGGDVTASTGCAIDTSDGKPGLPNSLSIEVVTDSGTRTCQITGTPTAAAVGENTYTIIGTNTTGDDASPATVKITVTATLAAPNLADLTDQSFTVGVLKTITFSNSGGDVTASTGCAIDTSDGKPGLPNSLGIEVVTDSGTRTCQITGTPTAAAVGENTYTIIGTNTTGDDASPATVKITVVAAQVLAAPNLTDLTDQSFTVGVLKTITFSNSGGDVTASTGCAIDTSDGKPGLPNSLSIEVVTDSGTRTCQITGTPTAAAVGENTYTIIGTNTTGDDASPATVKITVTATLAAPNLADLTDQSFTVGVPGTISWNNTGGGNLSSCTISPNLPMGLMVEPTAINASCQITGIATASATSTTYTVTAINSNGTDMADIELTIIVPAPNLADLTDQSFTVGVLKTITFSNSGGDVTASTGCAIDTSDGKPGLPNSLSIEVVTDSGKETCQITGTPTAAAVGENTYTIIGTNTTGDDASPATVKITVVAAQVQAAPNLVDLGNRDLVVATPGSIALMNEGGGQINNCGSRPALPMGLMAEPTADNASCQIAGTPASLSPRISYTITATNSGGNDDATVELEIVAPANTPPILADLADESLTVGVPVTIAWNNTGGDDLSSCTIGPLLPTGLMIRRTANNASCQITGTATAPVISTTYTVAATNPDGTDTTTIRFEIAVSVSTPPVLADLTSQSFTVGLPNTITLTSTGGGIGTCAIAPDLPTGLMIRRTDTKDGCQITGTAMAPVVSTTYTVTAENTSGADNASVELAIIVPAPNLADLGNQDLFVATDATIALVNAGGGQISNCASNPALPAGLSVMPSPGSSTTCQITGTPVSASPQTTYTITATNPGGIDDADVIITISSTSVSISSSTIVRSSGGATTIPATGDVIELAFEVSRPLTINPQALIGGQTAQVSPGSTSTQWTATITVDASFASDTDGFEVIVAIPNGDANDTDLGLGATVAAITDTPTPITLVPIMLFELAPILLDQSIDIAAVINQLITPIVLTNEGGNPASDGCTTSPALPMDLAISRTTDQTTCQITGTPTASVLPAFYTITATNPTGASSVMVRIGVQTAAGAALDTNQSVDFSGDADWRFQTAVNNDGEDAFSSGDINHNQSSCFSITVTNTAAVSFFWRVDSENNADFLRFSINDIEQNAISGELAWQRQTHNVPTSPATLLWCYEKNASVDGGNDVAYVDQLVLTINGPTVAITATNQVDLSWQAVATATHYQVFRHTVNNSFAATELTTGTDQTTTSYTDNTGVDNTTYYYWFKSCINQRCSNFSASTIATNRLVDTDSNGLIDITSLTQLHNTRFNLAGAAYQEGATGATNSRGCPDTGCAGYELNNDLDFDTDGDGTWTEDPVGTFMLDNDDNNAVYFDVDAGGWLPIGSHETPFTATFDGNGFAINGLAIQRKIRDVGFFGVLNTGANIRNLGLTNSFVMSVDDTAVIDIEYVGILAGRQDGSSLISASYVIGQARGDAGNSDRVGGLVGRQNDGTIIASFGIVTVTDAGGNFNDLGGLIGEQNADTASLYTSYAVGNIGAGAGNSDDVGGLVGRQIAGEIIASYAISNINGGAGDDDLLGTLIGAQNDGATVTASYGFGTTDGGTANTFGAPPAGVTNAINLTADNAGTEWNDADSNTLGAWDFGTANQTPALNYADYDGAGATHDCGQFFTGACGTLIPNQRPTEQLAVSSVELGAADAAELSWDVIINAAYYRVFRHTSDDSSNAAELTTGTDQTTISYTDNTVAANTLYYYWLKACNSSGCSDFGASFAVNNRAADGDGDGLIEIRTLTELNNIRLNLAGTEYRQEGFSNSKGCPDTGCTGYELSNDLDFDTDGDGTWSEGPTGTVTLDSDDNNDIYFDVDAGGWQPIGLEDTPFTAIFDGNGFTINGLAIQRSMTAPEPVPGEPMPVFEGIGMFAFIDTGAVIRNLGLIDNFTQYTGNSTSIPVGGLVGRAEGSSIVSACYTTGTTLGSAADSERIGGLVGLLINNSRVIASYTTGNVDGADSGSDRVGGLVGEQNQSTTIIASFARGNVDSGAGTLGDVGGLVGELSGGKIIASYATGNVNDNDDITTDNDYNVGGLVGRQGGGEILASYATGSVSGDDSEDSIGALVGDQAGGDATASYGFGATDGGTANTVGTPPGGVTNSINLTATNAGTEWNDADSNTLGAWDFGAANQIPVLNYADYDGTDATDGTTYNCTQFLMGACGTPIPDQRILSASSVLTVSIETLGEIQLTWEETTNATRYQVFRHTVNDSFTATELTAGTDQTATSYTDNTGVTNTTYYYWFKSCINQRCSDFSASVVATNRLVDTDSNGLIDITTLTQLHNIRFNLAGAAYQEGATSATNSSGCPGAVCTGYELSNDLDFDTDGDGTWSEGPTGTITLDSDDNNAIYFDVNAGGWQPIGSRVAPFTAIFDGNGFTINGLAIQRQLSDVGFFGALNAGANVRNIGLTNSLAMSVNDTATAENVGILAGRQDGSSLISASYVIGQARGDVGNLDRVGGLVGRQTDGTIVASFGIATVTDAGGNSSDLGGLVGRQSGGIITASYAMGNISTGAGNFDDVGGLVGYQEDAEIVASYATGSVNGGGGTNDNVGSLVGRQGSGTSVTASYGFGTTDGGTANTFGAPPAGVTNAINLTADNTGTEWNDADSNTLGAWDFGTANQTPALNYADYDGAGATHDCDQFFTGACGTLIPNQRPTEQLAVSSVELDAADAVELSWDSTINATYYQVFRHTSDDSSNATELTTGTDQTTISYTDNTIADNTIYYYWLKACNSSGCSDFGASFAVNNRAADGDGDGLIEIRTLTELNNIRLNLAGTEYRQEGFSNSRGCPDTGCTGYELSNDLDFDTDGDGTWSEGPTGTITLDSDDNNDIYFDVDTGGWQPIGSSTTPFTATFDGNGFTINGLAMQRSLSTPAFEAIGMFAVTTANAVIRNLGLTNNLAQYTGSFTFGIPIGGLVGSARNLSIISACYTTGITLGSATGSERIGGLVGRLINSSRVIASYTIGNVDGAGGDSDRVGGLVGRQDDTTTIIASFARGDVDSGAGTLGDVGGLVGQQSAGDIIASYATGNVNDNDDTATDNDYNVGGLVGRQGGGEILASYATGSVSGDDSEDLIGALVGDQAGGDATASYGFGATDGGNANTIGAPPEGVTNSINLTADNAGTEWNDADNNTLGAWDFGTASQAPVLNYADYDGTDATDGTTYNCTQFLMGACGTPIPDQGPAERPAVSSAALDAADAVELSWDSIINATYYQVFRHTSDNSSNATELTTDTTNTTASYTDNTIAANTLYYYWVKACNSSGCSNFGASFAVNNRAADGDGDGLIEIRTLAELNNIRLNLAGTEYRQEGLSNSKGCPDTGCTGYELSNDLDFDTDGDGTWSEGPTGTVTLDSDDNNDIYFDVDAGGWQPIGSSTTPFTATFDGNGFTINGLAMQRSLSAPAFETIGMFAATTANAVIRNLGLTNNLAQYTGSFTFGIPIGGLVGSAEGSSIVSACYTTGTTLGSAAPSERIGGLVGRLMNSGRVIASYTTGNVDGADSGSDRVGGLVGEQNQSTTIIASFARGNVDSGVGMNGNVGGLVGELSGGKIIASYATGNVNDNDDTATDNDYSVGGLVGRQGGGEILASYATGSVSGDDDDDSIGALVGDRVGGAATASYGFGATDGGNANTVGAPPSGVTNAINLTATNAGTEWNEATSNTLGAWDFGTASQAPVLSYADYDGIVGTTYNCNQFLTGACGSLIPAQRAVTTGLSPVLFTPINAGSTSLAEPILATGAASNPIVITASIQLPATNSDGESLSWQIISDPNSVATLGSGVLLVFPQAAESTVVLDSGIVRYYLLVPAR